MAQISLFRARACSTYLREDMNEVGSAQEDCAKQQQQPPTCSKTPCVCSRGTACRVDIDTWCCGNGTTCPHMILCICLAANVKKPLMESVTQQCGPCRSRDAVAERSKLSCLEVLEYFEPSGICAFHPMQLGSKYGYRLDEDNFPKT